MTRTVGGDAVRGWPSTGQPTGGDRVGMRTIHPMADVEPVLRRELRTQLSPRHVPDRFYVVDVIPRTLNGKKCEVPVKKILAGASPDKAVSRDALRDPESLDAFIKLRSGAATSL